MIRYFFIALLAVIGLWACSDSELIIPGEQVGNGNIDNGNGNGTDSTDTVSGILKQFVLSPTNLGNVGFNFATNGKLTQFNYSLQTATNNSVEVNFTRSTTSNRISAFAVSSTDPAVETENFVVSYNSDNRLEKIENQDQTKVMTFTYPGNGYNFNFTTNHSNGGTYELQTHTLDTNKIAEENIDLTTGGMYQLANSFTNNNIVSQERISPNPADTFVFTYDAKENPIFAQMKDEIVYLYFFQILYPNTAVFENLGEPLKVLIQGDNNMTSFNSLEDGQTFNFNYTYSAENKPLTVEITLNQQPAMSGIYTYYQ